MESKTNGIIEVPKDKYAQLTGKWINSYIDKLYEPFKIFCDPHKFLFETNPKYPKYITENKYYGGALMQIKYGSNGWILFEPTENELDKIETFKFIEEKRTDLVKLSALQLRLKEKKNSHEELLKIKDEIAVLFDEIFNPIVQNDDDEVPNKGNNAFCFTNNFDSVSPELIYNHFKKGLVESKMLSEKDLEKYLTSAFDKQEQFENKMRLTNVVSKKKVMRVFYLYFTEIASKPHGKKKSYVELLCNYFEGYETTNVSTNFSKSTY